MPFQSNHGGHHLSYCSFNWSQVFHPGVSWFSLPPLQFLPLYPFLGQWECNSLPAWTDHCTHVLSLVLLLLDGCTVPAFQPGLNPVPTFLPIQIPVVQVAPYNKKEMWCNMTILWPEPAKHTPTAKVPCTARYHHVSLHRYPVQTSKKPVTTTAPLHNCPPSLHNNLPVTIPKLIEFPPPCLIAKPSLTRLSEARPIHFTLYKKF